MRFNLKKKGKNVGKQNQEKIEVKIIGFFTISDEDKRKDVPNSIKTIN